MTQFKSMGIRMQMAFFVFLIVFAFLAYHLYGVQIVRHDELIEKAKKKYTITKTTDGRRGEIFDYSGYLFVGNRPFGTIIADPSGIKPEKTAAAADFLAKELSLDRAVLFRQLSIKKRAVSKNGKIFELPNQYLLLKTKIPFDEFERHRENILMENRKKECRGSLNAISFRTAFSRYYPKNNLLANILGFSSISRDEIVPVVGLEKSYGGALRPVKGKTTYERAKDGLPLSFGHISEQAERDGADIFLTIREPIQSIVEEELDKLMLEHRPKAAYAIMADPATGDILAVAQRPSFNPNEREKMDKNSWRNRLSEDVLEPGSIMKPFPVAGALDLGIVTPETKFDCERGRWYFGGKLLRDSHPIGFASVAGIIQESSNIGTAKIAIAMGRRNLHDTFQAFGFGQRTGIPIPNETRGIYRKFEKWDKLSITRFPIGQGIAASPFQLVKGYCMLANGGRPVALRLVDRTRVASTGKVERIPHRIGPSIYRRAATHGELISMLKRVTEPGGTATVAAVRGYNVAGKTGTAQKFIQSQKQYSHEKYTASFVGFVPAESPRFVLLVTVDEPSGKQIYGGAVSGPYFRSIAERTLKYMRVPPDIDPELYDTQRKLASKKVMDAKKKLWAEEARRRQERLAEKTRGTRFSRGISAGGRTSPVRGGTKVR